MNAALNLWVMPVRGESPRPVLERLLKPFLRARPGVEVRVSVIPWGTVWDRHMAALKGRRGAAAPDVLQLDAAWTGTLAHLGLLKELTSRLGELDREGVPPALWESGYFPRTRRLFAVPWTLDLRAVRVRAAALDEAGLSIDDLAAWEGWEELARRSAAQRRRLFLPRPGGEGLLDRTAPWVWAAGGQFFSTDERRPAFTEPEALKAFSFYRTLLTSGDGERGEPVLAEESLGAALPAAAEWAPLPRGPAGRFSFMGGACLALAAGGRHPEESWRLLLHLCSPEVRGSFAREMGLLPPAPQEEDLGPRAARESLSAARVPPSMALLGSFERLFHRHMAPVVRRPSPWPAWRDALEAAARETEVLLSHYEPPAG